MVQQTEEFKAVRLKLASPADILNWSYGEVTKPETINYRTQRPEKDGLFDEKIFGPIKDWECYCGKYKRIRYKGIICDKCGVEVTRASVRRERMGHIKLAAPVAHIWFLRGVPSRLGLVLDLSVQELEKVVYFASYIITSVDEEARAQTMEQIEREFKAKGKEIDNRYENLINQNKDKDEAETVRVKEMWTKESEHLESIRDLARSELKSIKKYQIISELEYRDLSLKYGPVFQAGIGASAIVQLVEEIDLEKLFADLQEEIATAEGVNKRKLIKRLKLVKSMIRSGIRPEWMIISNLPVIPPDLRPMVQLDGGRFAASDLNDLYRRVINRNNRLKKLLEIGAPEVITRNEKRMLQEAVDALIDNSIRHGKEVTASTGQKRKLRSLADMLKGKQGRFRQNLLGKRVDYSGRSVIVVGPKLKLHQCGLPKKMALELFKPFVISKLIQREYAHNVRSANRLIEQGATVVYDILEEVTKDHYVLLNRAPTLHRLGFQAFLPVLIEGKAIQIHPMVCDAYNADFDGDQMAVHVSLTAAAQEEAKRIMLSAKNLLKPASGEPVMMPTKDMVLGCYWLTRIQPGQKGEGMTFGSPQEAILAYQSEVVTLKAKVKIRLTDGWGNGGLTETCVGRILFNQLLPEGVRFINDVMDKKKLQQTIQIVYRDYGIETTAELLDEVKAMGFHYMTKSGLSWGMSDLRVPEMKKGLVIDADKDVLETYEQYRMGLLTETERKNRVIEIWAQVRDRLAEAVTHTLDEYGSVYQMITSGARGSISQLAQMSGMKGLVTNPAGEVIELPARDSFKEGLNILEYFISTHGSRKGMTDTALRTADAGYLTRRLVDVAQDIVVNAEDCGVAEGRIITRVSSEALGRPLSRRIFGRVLASDVMDADGKIVSEAGTLVDDRLALEIEKSTANSIEVRTVLRCKLTRGVCAKCYGYDLGFNKPVEQGAAVGIVAAQAIGEPGTQLTMRTFHTGGVAGLDITQGLPRVEELLEAREPKGQAVITELDGFVSSIKPSPKETVIRVEAKDVAMDEYMLGGAKLQLTAGEKVNTGDPLYTNDQGEVVKAIAAGIVKLGTDKLTVVRESENFQEYSAPAGFSVLVKEKDLVYKGQPLTEGNLNLHQLFALKGIEACQDYIIKDVQEIYSSQGQNVNEKHIEIIVRQMFSKVRIAESGDTDLLAGDLVDKSRLQLANEKVGNGRIAEAEQLLMGITKSSLNTESFLAAASFQETTRVLIEAAVTAKTDYLRGLKENVIIGKLIPAGTGYRADALAEKEAAELADNAIV
ncbi:MAG: DNA-directed RNA polymerase subunit beta' [Candidatus Doudnabacteria bacterium RIFCSPHIGHO2_02_FULL_42_25]|uniref:DNA-directed RNA polymerase subunit beta' n=1 Tax=Candidatus Doudnabacteria bacterium RIFCSPHIGHO2_01_FULL_41_86 TaxID=1817821 RepID=A0A1F5N7A5_9BACT|nr:MAG: DNA-directed RNA polymerase subunit beta' [Candidatus Doudnabacteria bacterium RIFCSPHIGHO2_01_FULL_41_86]OGE74669.1 MAG: DNA-directed RNA polymerase subunit beta' [Candidatus Doudnabacteria bacterium RIFCSPHIGHO2_01_43_10]OGE85028.1 MAG: DNA-directed RNA polymerase subunit beta' [Candidatus Doudnabacteria bacterium RIFCSPHIGHO2_12_FULL_42_22]OGE86469.1 MAG: DNA-directed RNA polymerase subunit beta' [Candidatus Doudnabacteria bacterium RIFCSPHIGHO2_02_FULL_42_25]OGE91931.1 MAG: DNA-dire